MLLSALLTAIYMLNVPIRAFFPKKDTDQQALQSICDVNGFMTVPMVLLAAANLVLGIYAKPLMDLVTNLLV